MENQCASYFIKSNELAFKHKIRQDLSIEKYEFSKRQLRICDWSQVWCYMLLIPIHGMQRQVDLCELEAILVYIENSVDLCELEAILVYVENSRPARVTY